MEARNKKCIGNIEKPPIPNPRSKKDNIEKPIPKLRSVKTNNNEVTIQSNHSETELLSLKTDNANENDRERDSFEKEDNSVILRQTERYNSNNKPSLHRGYTVEEVGNESNADIDIDFVGSTPVYLRSQSVTRYEESEEITKINAGKKFSWNLSSRTRRIDTTIDEIQKRANMCLDKINTAPVNENSYRELKKILLQSKGELKLTEPYNNKEQETRLERSLDLVNSLLHDLDAKYSKTVLPEEPK